MKKSYIVECHGYNNRALFYEYIHNRFKLKDGYYDKEYMCHSNYPFVIDLKKKVLYILESITCCACAAQNNQIISINKFKELI
ncbi:MAG: hypothetical protein VZS44_05515 [Bacilli bacterium]|nr:hypothetical protein [Bacilli bacterium]